MISRNYRPFVKGIDKWLMDSPHKGLQMWNVFWGHNVICLYQKYIWLDYDISQDDFMASNWQITSLEDK